jgi:hypothetical protein
MFKSGDTERSAIKPRAGYIGLEFETWNKEFPIDGPTGEPWRLARQPARSRLPDYGTSLSSSRGCESCLKSLSQLFDEPLVVVV